jgi:predicted nucleic acid-binding protein
VIIDTGPLVAALDAHDDHHIDCPHVEEMFLTSLADGEFELLHPTPTDLRRMAELVSTYQDLPLGAVDASVLAVAERTGNYDVATLDRRHFTSSDQPVTDLSPCTRDQSAHLRW